MKVILISGKAQHGKDTCGKFFDIELRAKGFSTQIVHFGDALKYVCSQYYNWNGEKDEVGRSILQTVGTEIVRRKDEHFWTDFVGRLARTFNCDYVIIPDWRFEEEHDRLLQWFDFNDIITIRVERFEKWEEEGEQIPFVNEAMTLSQLHHRSETELDNYPCQYHIVNTTFEELEQSVDYILEEIEPTPTFTMTFAVDENFKTAIGGNN